MNTEQFDGHTPGPWDADYGPIVATLDEGDSTDVLTIRVPTSEDDDVAWTNQLLAAAAPDLLAALIKEREENARLREALFACAEVAGDDPFFNKGGEGYEALFGGEEE